MQRSSDVSGLVVGDNANCVVQQFGGLEGRAANNMSECLNSERVTMDNQAELNCNFRSQYLLSSQIVGIDEANIN